MAVKKTRSAYVSLPGRQWLTRASLLMLLALGIALMVMSKTGNPAVTRLRMQITDLATPVLSVAARPMDAMHNAGLWISEMSRLRSENIALKNENIELLKWQSLAKSMATENASLRELLNVAPAHKNSFVTVRVVSDLSGPYVHSALVNGGGDNGVRKDTAAISAGGLLGRVVEVGDSSARVLLLGDINSRVPVFAERSKEKGILAGNNSSMPTLSYLAADSRIEVGERIVTSGDGGVFPPGIPVGIVGGIEQGVIRVQLFSDPAKTEYVSIVDHSL